MCFLHVGRKKKYYLLAKKSELLAKRSELLNPYFHNSEMVFEIMDLRVSPFLSCLPTWRVPF
jgi:hypothetical protein